jgi:signal transduction histidine kinase
MNKGKRKTEKTGERVHAKHISWKVFLITYAILTVLTGGQALIYEAYVPIENVPIQYILGIAGYWAIVSLVFCLVTSYQMYLAYDKPMHILSEAAQQVAGGDFSVWLEPVHRPDKKDYMDVMFEDFNTMVAELGSIETLKGDFIANVSHEIKTPLSVVQNYAMALQKEDLTPEQRREYTNTIITASKKLSTLVTNILKLNKLERQQITPVAEPYDLCRQLCDCALTFENLWEEKNIEFEANIEDRIVIREDESLLEIIWQNLLSNALKFTAPGGKVTLTQTSDENTVTVLVSDTGCGMDEKTMKHIFDKFYQGDGSHSQEGNGLGLALVLRAVELTGSSISVNSTPGKGSTFTVRLKKAEEGNTDT